MAHYRWTDEFSERLSSYQKKHRDSVQFVTGKLRVVEAAVENGGKLQNIKYGFLRHERDGVYAIRCSARGMRPLRLYFCISNRVIHLLSIGDKNSQDADIAWCAATANDIREGSYDEERSQQPPGGP